MYNRYDNDVHPRETVLDAVSSIIDHNDSLQDHIKFLSSVSMSIYLKSCRESFTSLSSQQFLAEFLQPLLKSDKR